MYNCKGLVRFTQSTNGLEGIEEALIPYKTNYTPIHSNRLQYPWEGGDQPRVEKYCLHSVKDDFDFIIGAIFFFWNVSYCLVIHY